MSYSGQNKQLQVKEVHSNRLGVGYTVTIKRYTSYIGERNPELKKAIKSPIFKDNTQTIFEIEIQCHHLPKQNINLFDYKIRRHFNVSSIPQYNNGYKKALELRQQYQQRQNYYIEDVTTKSNTNAHYVISEQDQVLINASDLFLRRTPTLDVDSHTTMSDNSYISAAE
ncbi:hypothetical protein GLOIN_2v1874770 [Rhizophagus irregularis DAOM 181602=DAOM 197198]|uniref:Uncharacterized protein n=1 Tax=Rhizophagus irregularis (strain DAOM 181602 / DAOM 197198 / MUCL 43194) TaxID=747089 RepID=A0A2P4Q5L7_RHIID|nr:hypothetical protein GLOIN_2v1874770 [Rhizophagus irregularis DAOM 181602=DAOM 197198]POG72936.1 hypothetical protein GLOIN_2v1874770 [Rhizophagus irregularis DAOM 181602=DAOM 197198]|eukprot:XP_025179802.1 hypothetical protein GLOIN_2v1874770 [Rhizophagus irregularis DAOM 181602=DAOM 197198]